MIRPLTCVCAVAACAAGLFLYQTKHHAQVLDRDIQRTVEATRTARERIGMLRAEWALLQEPERLKELADQHLPLRTLQPGQFVTLSDLSERLPAPVAPGTVQPEETLAPISAPMVQLPPRAPMMAAARPAPPPQRAVAPVPAPVAPVAQLAAARPPAPVRAPGLRVASATPDLPIPLPAPVTPFPQAAAPSVLAVNAQAALPMPVPPHAPGNTSGSIIGNAGGAVLSDSAPFRPARPVLAPVVAAVAAPIIVPPRPAPLPAAPRPMQVAAATGVHPSGFLSDSSVAVSLLGIAARSALAAPVPIRPAPGAGAR